MPWLPVITARLALGVFLAPLTPQAAQLIVLDEAARQLPDLPRGELVDQFVGAAVAEQTPRVPAELIVALGWGESRFEPWSGPGCGALQVFPRTIDAPPSACTAWRHDLRAGVHAGVVGIEMMLDDRRVRGDMHLALLYRSCGNSVFDGTCSARKHAWVRAAIARWRRIASESGAPRPQLNERSAASARHAVHEQTSS